MYKRALQLVDGIRAWAGWMGATRVEVSHHHVAKWIVTQGRLTKFNPICFVCHRLIATRLHRKFAHNLLLNIQRLMPANVIYSLARLSILIQPREAPNSFIIVYDVTSKAEFSAGPLECHQTSPNSTLHIHSSVGRAGMVISRQQHARAG
jgi:hypothetical protein